MCACVRVFMGVWIFVRVGVCMGVCMGVCACMDVCAIIKTHMDILCYNKRWLYVLQII